MENVPNLSKQFIQTQSTFSKHITNQTMELSIYLAGATILLILLFIIIRSNRYLQFKRSMSRGNIPIDIKSDQIQTNLSNKVTNNRPIYIIVNDCITKIDSNQIR